MIGLAGVALLACSDAKDTPPTPPAQNDPTFVVDGVNDWYLVGNPLTPGGDRIDIVVTPPTGVERVTAWLNGRAPIELSAGSTGYTASIDISDLGVGTHPILLSADGAEVGFAALTFRRSHPVYIVVSTDWDNGDNSEMSYSLQEALHSDHPELLITHFAAPYTFTDPAITVERRSEIADWLIGMRDDHGDEIGLHIHPYCHFVESAGLPCKTDPSTVYAAGDESGYTVMVSAYDRDEFGAQLIYADALFAAAGLGKPTSFRAGGWTASTETLIALDQHGYVADTSALNWHRMEEWIDVQNGVLYDWNSTQWSQIDETSQPYYPGETDIQTDSANPIGILEVPDNGIMVDYVTGPEMIEILGSNWNGQPLSAPVQVSVGYHPGNYDLALHGRMNVFLNHADQFLSVDGTGPIVYSRLSDLVAVWPREAGRLTRADGSLR